MGFDPVKQEVRSVGRVPVSDDQAVVRPGAHPPAVDFHSPEFNRTDDLNDWSGNYLLFEGLDDVVTAHERHQTDRGRVDRALDPPADRAATQGKRETGSDDREPTEMPGLFEEAQPISFLERRCFHGRSRARDCHQCLDVCPCGALESTGRAISIKYHLCRACGGCALVCPSDAIRVMRPSKAELIDLLRTALEQTPAGAESAPALVISDAKENTGCDLSGKDQACDDRTVYVQVEQIAHVGMEVLLAAIALGSGPVVVACSPRNPPTIEDAVKWQVEMTRALLRGLGLPQDTCRFTTIPPAAMDPDTGGDKPTHPGRTSRSAPGAPGPTGPIMLLSGSAAHDARTDKRALVHAAAQHLYDQLHGPFHGPCGAQERSLPLPLGAPFGTVAVDNAACTLCMACAAACPSGALSAGTDLPRLLFRESQCHQCGLCREVCPEGAIQLLPRLLCDRGMLEARRPLHEAEPLRCVECGVPFGSHAMMNRIREKLSGHWMYADERQLRRLQMCRTCSARDALASMEMNGWKLQ